MVVEFKIKRIDDRSLVKVFEKARKAGEAALKEAEGTLKGQGHEIQCNYSSGLSWLISKEDFRSAPVGQFVVSSSQINFRANSLDGRQKKTETVSFSFSRGGNDTLVDRFTLSPSGQASVMNGKGEQSVQKAIHKALSPLLQPVAPEDGGLIPTLSNLTESFSTTYQRISEELSNAVAAVSKERSQQITEFEAERKRLQKEVAEERATVLKDAREDIEKQRAELNTEREKLSEEWTQLEVSSHKDARRKQFQKLQDELQSALEEPVADKDLRKTRWAVFGSLVAAACLAAFFAFLSISSLPISASSTASWVFPAIRMLVLTFVSLASFLGAAAWLRYFYVRELQAHEELRRFRNDMARASWVMDAALEIRKEHNEDIPSEWIAGVTEGLFSARKKETLEEGAQALAALMGLSASASFGPGGATVELSKKGGKVISAAAKQDNQQA